MGGNDEDSGLHYSNEIYCFMDGMNKQRVSLYVNILNVSPIMAAINLAPVHLDNNFVKFWA
jgi:hypothetical protein